MVVHYEVACVWQFGLSCALCRELVRIRLLSGLELYIHLSLEAHIVMKPCTANAPEICWAVDLVQLRFVLHHSGCRWVAIPECYTLFFSTSRPGGVAQVMYRLISVQCTPVPCP